MTHNEILKEIDQKKKELAKYKTEVLYNKRVRKYCMVIESKGKSKLIKLSRYETQPHIVAKLSAINVAIDFFESRKTLDIFNEIST